MAGDFSSATSSFGPWTDRPLGGDAIPVCLLMEPSPSALLRVDAQPLGGRANEEF